SPGEQTVLRIIDVGRLAQFATAVNKAFPKISEDDFLKTAVVGDRRNTVLSGLGPDQSLEGFLFPDTYFFKPTATPGTIVDTLLDQFEQRAGQTLRQAAVENKTTIYDIVKLASIVGLSLRSSRSGVPSRRTRSSRRSSSTTPSSSNRSSATSSRRASVRKPISRRMRMRSPARSSSPAEKRSEASRGPWCQRGSSALPSPSPTCSMTRGERTRCSPVRTRSPPASLPASSRKSSKRRRA